MVRGDRYAANIGLPGKCCCIVRVANKQFRQALANNPRAGQFAIWHLNRVTATDKGNSAFAQALSKAGFEHIEAVE
ncbi:hypothetical protein D3C81_2248190 [compost metagenome]